HQLVKPTRPHTRGAMPSRVRTFPSRALAITLCLCVASVAFAQTALPTRKVGLDFEGSVPSITVSIADLANAEVRRSLESGLRKHVVITVEAHQRDSGALIASGQQACRVTYDPWGDNFIVEGVTSSVEPSL